ncbi:hypothetical protein KIW84_075267 [Lathyrus oleraceus]|uniref:Uncharacterized protein n=1 Tax=Pisum sativum TaxID=3888 RepID=A0A9D4ZZM4_PEA|nr:hypothetical protein KIW84_075267 [Pisum sativum]
MATPGATMVVTRWSSIMAARGAWESLSGGLMVCNKSQLWSRWLHLARILIITDNLDLSSIRYSIYNLDKKNKRFLGRINGFRGSRSKYKKDDQKECLNCKKPDHFIADCLELQKDKSNKGSHQKDNFINKVKKSLMATWDELEKEEEVDKDEEEANLSLMALTSSDIESYSDSSLDFEEEYEVLETSPNGAHSSDVLRSTAHSLNDPYRINHTITTATISLST